MTDSVFAANFNQEKSIKKDKLCRKNFDLKSFVRSYARVGCWPVLYNRWAAVHYCDGRFLIVFNGFPWKEAILFKITKYFKLKTSPMCRHRKKVEQHCTRSSNCTLRYLKYSTFKLKINLKVRSPCYCSTYSFRTFLQLPARASKRESLCRDWLHPSNYPLAMFKWIPHFVQCVKCSPMCFQWNVNYHDNSRQGDIRKVLLKVMNFPQNGIWNFSYLRLSFWTRENWVSRVGSGQCASWCYRSC